MVYNTLVKDPIGTVKQVRQCVLPGLRRLNIFDYVWQLVTRAVIQLLSHYLSLVFEPSFPTPGKLLQGLEERLWIGDSTP